MDEVGVREVVPFFRVRSMAESVDFYSRLGFSIEHRWDPDGELRWCQMRLGGAAVMLQAGDLPAHPGEGVSVCIFCRDALALYRQASAAGLAAGEPFVGNSLWVVALNDPNGYRIEFESPTDVPEGTRYQAIAH